jgi:ferredoxin
VTDQSPAFTWQDDTYRFCSEEDRDAFATDPAGYFIHTMWGIPNWLYSVSVGLVLVLSFGLFELYARRRRNAPERKMRVDLLRIPFVASVLRWPPFRFLCQLVFVLLFGLIIIAGLFGNQLAAMNIAPLLTWTIWWGGLVILIMFLGKAWCYVCPWDAIAGWIERLRFWGVAKDGIGLGLKWPKALRNIFLATFFFVGLTWLELGFGITMSPQATAMLGLVMLSLTILAVLIFERRAFCRYACLVGRVSGLYSMFSATEVRAVDPEVCRTCVTKDCYHGNDKGYGCPTGLLPGTLSQNTYCISCMECVKTCPVENMTIQARPWGSDLAAKGRQRKDEAYLALLMLAITGFHGLTMTPVWGNILGAFEGSLGLTYIPSFSLGMALIMLGPILIYAGLMKFSVMLSGRPEVSYGKAFIAFAYSLLPIALFYHLAHNLEHMLMEGQKVIPLISNPLGYVPGDEWSLLGFSGVGPWDLFSTRDWTIAPLVSLPTLWALQVILVLVGHVFALWVADRTARRLYPQPGAAFRSQLPMLVGMVLFSIFSLWLLKQPMEMRTSAM